MLVKEIISLYKSNKVLVNEMAKRDLSDRYTGQVFGIFWVFAHPIIMMMIYVFVFSVVFKMRVPNSSEFPLDYTTFLLSGLIPWLVIQESMLKSSTTITSHANLVKQVMFPVDILPLKGLISSMYIQLIFIAILLIYVVLIKETFYLTFLLYPILLFFQFIFLLGLGFFLSAIGVYFKDTKDILQVISLAGIYITPIFYLPSMIPELFAKVMYFNPFSHLIWCYQDVFYYGEIRHFDSWAIQFVLSISLFIFGYKFFKKVKIMFGNVL